MQAGKLRHMIEIQKSTPTQSALGEETQAWSKVADVWASIKPISGRERFSQLGVQNAAQMDTVITIRYRAAITPKMRVLWSGHIYDIEAVRNLDERRVTTELLCREFNA